MKEIFKWTLLLNCFIFGCLIQKVKANYNEGRYWIEINYQSCYSEEYEIVCY